MAYHNSIMTRWWQILAIACLAGSTVGNFNATSSAESLYELRLQFSSTAICTRKTYGSICSEINYLDYKQCAVLTETCNVNAVLRVSFPAHKQIQTIQQQLNSLKSVRGMPTIRKAVADVNECLEKIDTCSRNGYCTNTEGSYRCQCSLGFTDPESSTTLSGSYCVAKCNARSCRNSGVCSQALDELSEARCDCANGYTGDRCQEIDVSAQLPWSTIIAIAVIAGLAALVGLGLCVFACYRLFCRRTNVDDSDFGSIRGYKPRGMPHGDYDRMTDLGSISRSNRGFASTIDEESERDALSVKNDGLKFGTKLMSSRLSIPSEHGDPTPVLNPHNLTDRHAATDIVSQPDYY